SAARARLERGLRGAADVRLERLALGIEHVLHRRVREPLALPRGDRAARGHRERERQDEPHGSPPPSAGARASSQRTSERQPGSASSTNTSPPPCQTPPASRASGLRTTSESRARAVSAKALIRRAF